MRFYFSINVEYPTSDELWSFFLLRDFLIIEFVKFSCPRRAYAFESKTNGIFRPVRESLGAGILLYRPSRKKAEFPSAYRSERKTLSDPSGKEDFR